MNPVPRSFLKLNPLMKEAGYRLLKRIRQHPKAPAWNFVPGDHVTIEDLKSVEEFRRQVFSQEPRRATAPPPSILSWVRSMVKRSWAFERRIPRGFDIEGDWAHIPTMSREDIATKIEEVVPADEDLDRLIVYDTSGTTGHALLVPHHPGTVAMNHALVEYVLDRYNALGSFSAPDVACINACAQVNTYVFTNVFSVWRDAGFVKLNLHPRDWKNPPFDARDFFTDFPPAFITADPITFAEMIRWNIPVRPSAMLSTAVELSPGLKKTVEEHFKCPVIDWYSTTETGPVAFASPDGAGMEFMSPDIYVEIVDREGYPLPDGELGEITITGGRNPYLPLLRYRTGDSARIRTIDIPGQESVSRLFDLTGREVVFYRATDGSLVNPVDIGRIMRLTCPFVQHQFIQRKDGSCLVLVRPAPNVPTDSEGIETALRSLFGSTADIEVRITPDLGDELPGGKTVTFKSELDLHPESRD